MARDAGPAPRDPGRARAAPAAPGLLRIADAARAVGVSPSALRLWERQGLVDPVRNGGRERRYGR
jgi:transposase-like protein